VRETDGVITDHDRCCAGVAQLSNLTDAEVRQVVADIARNNPRALELPLARFLADRAVRLEATETA
jgi:hypothetical protein